MTNHFLRRGQSIVTDDGRTFYITSVTMNYMRILTRFEHLQLQCTRASINKRNRHAKRPNGRNKGQ